MATPISALFQPTRPARGATGHRFYLPAVSTISTHAPRKGRDECILFNACKLLISTHAPRKGRDGINIVHKLQARQISTHAPRKGRDHKRAESRTHQHNFNPRAPQGARHDGIAIVQEEKYFNPRAPQGARLLHERCLLVATDFNPRAPQGARLDARHEMGLSFLNFNPRAPQGARRVGTVGRADNLVISTHAPRKGRDTETITTVEQDTGISTHAPRKGRDLTSVFCMVCKQNFNPRAPQGARPSITSRLRSRSYISTHAPRKGRDRSVRTAIWTAKNFNPRAPQGARPRQLGRCHFPHAGFQPTRPARGATDRIVAQRKAKRISTHAPRKGRDRRPCSRPARSGNFNPRAPQGARRR